MISTGTPLPFLAGDSLIVDLAEERVVERLQGLRPVPRVWYLVAETTADPMSPVSYFADEKGRLVRIDFATGERRIVAGPGAPRGRAAAGLLTRSGSHLPALDGLDHHVERAGGGFDEERHERLRVEPEGGPQDSEKVRTVRSDEDRRMPSAGNHDV